MPDAGVRPDAFTHLPPSRHPFELCLLFERRSFNGHVFVALRQGGTVTHNVSFYPSRSVRRHPLKKKRGELRDESGRDFHRAAIFDIDETGYRRAVETIDHYREHPPDYRLVGFVSGARNCVNICRTVMRAAGINVSRFVPPWPAVERSRVKRQVKKAEKLLLHRFAHTKEALPIPARYVSEREISCRKQPLEPL